MSPLMEYLRKLMDANDTASLMRFLTFLTVITIRYVWVVFSIYARKIVDLPPGVVAFAGLVVGGKALQSFSEHKTIQTKREDET